MSSVMRKLDFCLFENKGTDQLRSKCEADQRLCFRYTDSKIPLLLISKISSFQPASVTVFPVVGNPEDRFRASRLIFFITLTCPYRFFFSCKM